MRAYETGDDELIEKALLNVTAVRRMKRNGTLDELCPKVGDGVIRRRG